MVTGVVLRHRTSQKYKKELQTPAGRKIISKIGSDLVAPSSRAVKLVTAEIELVSIHRSREAIYALWVGRI
jgi:hypothetical protein